LGGELSVDTRERRLIAVLRNVGNQLVILSVPAVAFGVFFADSAGFARPQLNPAAEQRRMDLQVFCNSVADDAGSRHLREIACPKNESR
jgi:hypothetical protein